MPDKTSSPATILAEIASLREQLERHNSLYHTHDSPEIPDADYDALLARLVQLETQYDVDTAGSPSQRVGASPLAGFEQIKHEQAICTGLVHMSVPGRSGLNVRFHPHLTIGQHINDHDMV